MNFLQFNPRVIGHRGACAYAPENTMSSFVKAAQLGIQWVEFDVMQAAGGEVVIFHDESLDRTSDGRGKIHQFPLSYLESLDAGSWFHPHFSGERIPALLTVIQFLQEANMSANIELKAVKGQEKNLVKRVMDELSPFLKNRNHQFIFSSFSIETLYYLREYDKDCQIGLLLHEWKNDWEKICESLQCVSVHVNHEIMTKTKAKKIHSLHKALLCYTVNDAARANKLFSWGVDAVFSDAPDKIIIGIKNDRDISNFKG
jgi:glycerophosphoryl diester phosphodiesterase